MHMYPHNFLLEGKVPVGGWLAWPRGSLRKNPSFWKGPCPVPGRGPSSSGFCCSVEWVPLHKGDEITTCPIGQHFPEIHVLKNNSFSL